MTYRNQFKMLQKIPRITATLGLLLVVLPLTTGYSFARNQGNASFELSGTIWDSASEGTGVKPELLYAVALQESRKMVGKGMAAPDPFVIRYGNQVDRFDSYAEARNFLEALTGRPDTILKRLDIGLMQINAGWNGHRVEQLSDFLVPGIAIKSAANILAEIAEHTSDPVSRIGRYHSYTPDLTAKYGSAVQGIYCRLIENNDLDICGGIYGQQ